MKEVSWTFFIIWMAWWGWEFNRHDVFGTMFMAWAKAVLTCVTLLFLAVLFTGMAS